MKELQFIRSLYKPIQPAIRHADTSVTYGEYLPHSLLRNFIYCYWELKGNESSDVFYNYSVVADGCIDVFFNREDMTHCFVMGFCKEYEEFRLQHPFDFIGIRFFPSVFPWLFHISGKELYNECLLLDDVLPNLSRLISREIRELKTSQDILGKLDDYLLAKISDASLDFDPRFYNALHLILNQQGTISLEKLNTGISPRQLRRLFDHHIGSSPKSFSKVVRFQNILNAKPSVQSLKQNKLFYKAGYFDQAHFIKEFKSLYGMTPKQAFQ